MEKDKKAEDMRCVICKIGKNVRGKALVVLERGQTVVVIRHVPAEICDGCGEYYLDRETSKAVMTLAQEAVLRGVEVEIVRYAA